MDTTNIKVELIKRYKYLYSNAATALEFLDSFSYLANDILNELELLLLGDTPIEDTNICYLIEQFKKTCELKEKDDDACIYELLNRVKFYIMKQYLPKNTKTIKLEALEEYFKIHAYRNKLEIDKTPSNRILLGFNQKFIPKFAKILADKDYKNGCDNSFLSKQEIYHEFQDDFLPFLRITCESEIPYYPTQTLKVSRPENTKACKELFALEEENIFVNKYDYLYRFFTICPHCGYIVNVPKEIIPDRVKKRIEEKYKLNPNIYSEKFAESSKLATRIRSNRCFSSTKNI